MKLDDLSTDVLMNITARPDLVFVRGEGAWLWDHHGKRYLDFIQGWAVNSLGHSPKIIHEVLVHQGARLICPSPAFYNEPSLHWMADLGAVRWVPPLEMAQTELQVLQEQRPQGLQPLVARFRVSGGSPAGDLRAVARRMRA